MLNSIQQFIEHGVKNLQKASKDFSDKPGAFAEFVYKVRDEALQMALDYIAETLNSCDQIIRDCPQRYEDWVVVRTDQKELVTSIGKLTFNKTLFKNKKTGKTRYLVDDLLGFDRHERLSEDAIAEMLKESTESSYRKGGKAASIMEEVSKETVKDKIHALEFPKEQKRKGKKRKVEYLYIEADEDHVSLQFQNRRGDLKVSESGRKINGMITKLVYVHEGVEKDAPKSRRHHLINPHYFSGAYEGRGNAELWDEVYRYIENNYELDEIKKIYLGADGGAWIRSASKRIAGITYVLDEFHLRKYLIKMTNHMLDSADNVRKMLCDRIKNGNKEEFLSLAETLYSYADNECDQKRIMEGTDFILSNWSAAKVRLKVRKIPGCSAEGHVSHVLSKRMSTAAMGWSRKGADKMANLRAYVWNNRDMLELVRYQKSVKKKAAGAEGIEDIVSGARQIRQTHPAWGKYVDAIQAEISYELKKWMSIGLHSYVWKLF